MIFVFHKKGFVLVFQSWSVNKNMLSGILQFLIAMKIYRTTWKKRLKKWNHTKMSLNKNVLQNKKNSLTGLVACIHITQTFLKILGQWNKFPLILSFQKLVQILTLKNHLKLKMQVLQRIVGLSNNIASSINFNLK